MTSSPHQLSAPAPRTDVQRLPVPPPAATLPAGEPPPPWDGFGPGRTAVTREV
ncbi:hypothetical protein [Streptomyces sp. NPDC048172]|uniref:hypothetical protein n=1 Tax=Streptomyces sp. NPDC048172 TaxID=3365505 RepID=UPI00371BF87D